MMLLKKLIIKNLRSFENQEIIFPKGSILLSGDIGAGKTTVLLGVEFALFGLQPSQKAASLLKNDKDNGTVILEFEIENKKVIIERSLKRNKNSISQEYTSLTIDNEKFEESVTEIKSKVLNLLNYPSEFAKKTNLLYRFTVYTPQEEMKQIVLESREVRLDILRHVFGIDKYKRIQENADILSSRLREKIRINEALLSDLDRLKAILEEKEKNSSDLKKIKEEIDEKHKQFLEIKYLKELALKEIEEKINEKKMLENEKEKSVILILEKKQQVLIHQKNIDDLYKDIKEAKKLDFGEDKYNSLNQRIKYQQEKEEEYQKSYIENVGKIKSFESKIVEINELIKKIYGLDKCPTCLQNVLEEYKKNILEKANREKQETENLIKDLKNNKEIISSEISDIKKTKEDFLKQKSEFDILKFRLENIKEKEKRKDEIEVQKNFLEKDISILQEQILTIEKAIKEFEKFDIIFKERTKELEQAKKNESDIAIKKVEIFKEIEFVNREIKEKNREIEEKNRLTQKTEKMKGLEYWLTEKFLSLILFTEKQVMITLKEQFSNLFSRWFSALVSDSLTAKIDDDFSPRIEQKDYELDYSFLSGGERTAIALSYRLALNQVINSLLSNLKTSNIIILDEPTDGFSAQQLEKMREVLRELNTEQLIIVSHEQRMEDFVDNIIRIRKKDGISEIEEKSEML